MELSQKVCLLQQKSGLDLMIFLEGQFLHVKEIQSFALRRDFLLEMGRGDLLLTDPNGRMIDG